MSLKELLNCQHPNTRELRPKVYDYNMNPPEHILIIIQLVLCMQCGEKIKTEIIKENIISYCDIRTNPLCDGIIREGQEIKGSEECSLCKEK